MSRSLGAGLGAGKPLTPGRTAPGLGLEAQRAHLSPPASAGKALALPAKVRGRAAGSAQAGAFSMARTTSPEASKYTAPRMKLICAPHRFSPLKYSIRRATPRRQPAALRKLADSIKPSDYVDAFPSRSGQAPAS